MQAEIDPRNIYIRLQEVEHLANIPPGLVRRWVYAGRLTRYRLSTGLAHTEQCALYQLSDLLSCLERNGG